jgi:hypothetical protein
MLLRALILSTLGRSNPLPAMRLLRTNRSKQLVAILVAATWVSFDAVRLDRYWYEWSFDLAIKLAAQSLPVVLFAGVVFWWYSKPAGSE